MAAQNNNLRDELFPDGKPSPEEAIRTLALYIRKQLGMDDSMRDFLNDEKGALK